jgi:hypothetical protein
MVHKHTRTHTQKKKTRKVLTIKDAAARGGKKGNTRYTFSSGSHGESVVDASGLNTLYARLQCVPLFNACDGEL